VPITIEFYGIARQRAGCAAIEVEAASVSAALDAAVEQCPRLAECYSPVTGLRTGYLLNLRGEQFLSDLSTPLTDEDCLLLLSSDAGG
jgi:molybdopterin converting factor small subunit